MERKINLQMFAEAVQGKKIVYLYRVLSKAATNEGAALAFTTENGNTISKDADSTATKDGSIRTPAVAEVEITATSILAQGDTLIDELKAALNSDELIEIWETNLAEPGTDTNAGKFKATYYQGYLTELEKSSNAEDMVEMSLTFGINGTGADGYATVSAEQQEVANYVFKDTTKTGA